MNIRYNGEVETKPNGQKMNGRSRPAFRRMSEQLKYGKGSCNSYSLFMGRAFKPNQYAVLLDFDNKDEGDVQNTWKLGKKQKVDQYDTLKQ